jgi:hypothetical protein
MIKGGKQFHGPKVRQTPYAHQVEETKQHSPWAMTAMKQPMVWTTRGKANLIGVLFIRSGVSACAGIFFGFDLILQVVMSMPVTFLIRSLFCTGALQCPSNLHRHAQHFTLLPLF